MADDYQGTVPTVAVYYREKLGRPLRDPQRLCSKPGFTIATDCGRSCRQAIDAAAGMLAHVEASVGKRGPDYSNVVRALEEVVLTYVYG